MFQLVKAEASQFSRAFFIRACVFFLILPLAIFACSNRSAQTIQQLSYENITSSDQNVGQEYPFISKDILHDLASDENGPNSPFLGIEKISDSISGDNLMILRIESAEYCGTHGCSLKVFRKSITGNQYELILDLISGNAYVQKCQNQLYLISDNGNGLYRWEYKSSKFILEKDTLFKRLADIPRC
jgi:hypothetical protein